MAANMSQDLGLETQVGNGYAIESGLLRSGRGGQLDVLDTEIIERLGDLNLLGGVKESVGELLAFAQGGLDDGPIREAGQRVSVLGGVGR